MSRSPFLRQCSPIRYMSRRCHHSMLSSPLPWWERGARNRRAGRLRREAEVSGHRRRHVEEHLLLAELVRANAPLQKPPEDVQVLALAAVNEQRLELADQ